VRAAPSWSPSETGTLSGLTVNANGGNGANSYPTGPTTAPHGPGGGGGGGVVYTNASGAVFTATAGINGTSTTNLNQYNAQPGTVGTVSPSQLASSVPGARSGSECPPLLTVAKSTTTPNVGRGGTAAYTVTVSNAQGTARDVALTDALPGGLTLNSAFTVTLAGGATRTTTSEGTTGTGNVSVSSFRLPQNAAVTVNWTALVPTGAAPATLQNSATATYTATDGSGTASATYTGSSSTAEDVTVRVPVVTLTKTVQNITAGTAAGTTGTGLPGDTLEYCLAYANTGNGTATSVVLTDTVPTNVNTNLSAYGTGLGIQLNGTNLTSAIDTDAATLSSTALKVTVGTIAVGATGKACFRASIR